MPLAISALQLTNLTLFARPSTMQQTATAEDPQHAR